MCEPEFAGGSPGDSLDRDLWAVMCGCVLTSGGV